MPVGECASWGIDSTNLNLRRTIFFSKFCKRHKLNSQPLMVFKIKKTSIFDHNFHRFLTLCYENLSKYKKNCENIITFHKRFPLILLSPQDNFFLNFNIIYIILYIINFYKILFIIGESSIQKIKNTDSRFF